MNRQLIKFNHFLLILVLIFISGCYCTGERIHSLTDEGTYSKTWQELLKENPIGKDENIKATLLFRTGDSSHHIIQINGREKPHIHEMHDLTVFVKKGKGTLHLGEKKLSMKRGDVAFIPKGTRHYFANKDKKDSAVAYVIFSPAYDGKDMKLVE